MAQTVILAAATTAGTSTDVTLAAGAYARISIYTAVNSQIPAHANLELRTDTGGADALVAVLGQNLQTYQLIGPGVFRVYRPPQQVAIGVSSET